MRYRYNLNKTMKGYLLVIISVLSLLSCDRNRNKCGNDDNEVAKEGYVFFENAVPVDLTEVTGMYDLYKKSDDEKKLSIELSFVDVDACKDDISLIEDTSLFIHTPEYEKSDVPFLAQAEDFYNSCSYTWNIWSNFEVWYRGHTSGELCGDEEIIRSINRIGNNIIKDTDIKKAAQNYKDSIFVMMAKPLDEWDDDNNAWNVRNSIMKVIEKHTCRFYNDKESFQLQYDSIVRTAEGMGIDKYNRYLASGEEKQLEVILTELNNCKSFDEQCSLWRNWANSEKSRYEGVWLVLVGKKLLENHKYNPNLNRIWITWRAICQMDYFGSSKDSEIPNYYYNKYRKMCYLTCLKRIERHQEDVFAKNCAASLAGNPNILRFGRFEYGNESVMDAFEMMPNRHNLDDEEE